MSITPLPEHRVTFVRRPEPLSPDLRPAWMVGAVTLVLKSCCKGGRSSHARLHVLLWALLSRETRSSFRQARAGEIGPESIVVRFDPTIDLAIDFALGEHVVERVGGTRVQLTARGKELAERLSNIDTFTIERDFLEELGTWPTEDRVSRLLRMEQFQ